MLSERIALFAFVTALTISLGGCHLGGRQMEERRLSVLRSSQPAGARILEIQVTTEALEKALAQKGSLQALRIIEIYNPDETTSNLPRYRLFNIAQNDPFSAVGLQNGDVLVGLNDRIVVDPNILREAVRLLPHDRKIEIEVQRGEVPIIIRCSTAN